MQGAPLGISLWLQTQPRNDEEKRYWDKTTSLYHVRMAVALSEAKIRKNEKKKQDVLPTPGPSYHHPCEMREWWVANHASHSSALNGASACAKRFRTAATPKIDAIRVRARQIVPRLLDKPRKRRTRKKKTRSPVKGGPKKVASSKRDNNNHSKRVSISLKIVAGLKRVQW